MDGFGPTSFGSLNAQDYDQTQDPGTTEVAVQRIAEMAGQGRVLELAVGTGRIALPLAARGVDVTGLEISPEMVAKLREKPGGADLPVVMGDMADVDVEGPFDLVVLVFNTLFNLTSQDAQVRLFRNVAARLAPGGRFLVETFVPDPTRYQNHQWVGIRQLQMDSLWLDAVRDDPVEQVLTMQRLRFENGQGKLVPLVMRYAWPAELDLMAQLAGLTLRSRWDGWHQAPFTADSRAHVSIWAKPAAG